MLLKKWAFPILTRNSSTAAAQAKKLKINSGEKFNVNTYYSSKKLKQHKESFLNLDYYINANYNYESLHYGLISH